MTAASTTTTRTPDGLLKGVSALELFFMWPVFVIAWLFGYFLGTLGGFGFSVPAWATDSSGAEGEARTPAGDQPSPEPDCEAGATPNPALDAFAVLGLPHDAGRDDVKRAYRDLCRMYHPDRVAHLGLEFQALAHRKMSSINSAYQALTWHA